MTHCFWRPAGPLPVKERNLMATCQNRISYKVLCRVQLPLKYLSSLFQDRAMLMGKLGLWPPWTTNTNHDGKFATEIHVCRLQYPIGSFKAQVIGRCFPRYPSCHWIFPSTHLSLPSCTLFTEQKHITIDPILQVKEQIKMIMCVQNVYFDDSLCR